MGAKNVNNHGLMLTSQLIVSGYYQCVVYLRHKHIIALLVEARHIHITTGICGDEGDIICGFITVNKIES